MHQLLQGALLTKPVRSVYVQTHAPGTATYTTCDAADALSGVQRCYLTCVVDSARCAIRYSKYLDTLLTLLRAIARLC